MGGLFAFQSARVSVVIVGQPITTSLRTIHGAVTATAPTSTSALAILTLSQRLGPLGAAGAISSIPLVILIGNTLESLVHQLRAYRIGQTRTVQVHKFVVRGTLEERIDHMIESKTELAENIIGQGEQWLSELSTDQLREILTLRNDAIDDLD